MSIFPQDASRPYAVALAELLVRTGAVRTQTWEQAFASVPRHVLVPSWYEQETHARGIAVWRRRGAADESGLADVYRDVTLVTGLDPATAQQVDEDAWTGVATSSSTIPSLMAGMLEDLDIQDGHRVMEIGTGTGYNAALLSARLGEEFVHSMDIDQQLVDLAQKRLDSIGYQPQLLSGDGTQGWPDGGPFDRIMATCSVSSVPAAWVEQLRPGGVLLTDVALGIEGGLVRLSPGSDGEARGFFTTNTGRFMAARSRARTYQAQDRPERAPAARSRPSTLTANAIQAHYPLRLALAFQMPGTELVYYVDDTEGMSIQLQRDDGSWARVPIAGTSGLVTFGGDEGLWKQAEEAWAWWNHADRPAQDRFGYVREPDGSAYVWYLPDGSRWSLTG
ncbi:methyltransferase domain-containing protein [Streptomyces sp. NPDC051105]|uniref:methyltransferase domain-containing protein n=1 Tax=Streptomyces sp. NPDC051105 TaxID=3154843 RepID=UPI00343EF5AC